MDTLSLQYDIHKNMRIMPKTEKAEEPKEKLNADKDYRTSDMFAVDEKYIKE